MTNPQPDKCAILFVHGIVGNSDFFDFLVDALPRGVHTVALTLSGHGGNALDFSKASMAQWIAQVDEAAKNLKAKHKKVIIVAHSMGTLFAINQAVAGRADALFLLNPPLKLRLTRRLFATPAKIMLGRVDDPVTKAAKAAYGIAIDRNPLHYYGWPARYIELFREITRTRKIVGRLRCKLHVFISGRDEMIAPSVASYFTAIPGCQVTIMPRSGHYFYTTTDRTAILQSLTTFIEEYL